MAAVISPLEQHVFGVVETPAVLTRSDASTRTTDLSKVPMVAAWTHDDPERRALFQEVHSCIKTECVLELGSTCALSSRGKRFPVQCPAGEGSGGSKRLLEEMQLRGAARVDVVLVNVGSEKTCALFDLIWNTPELLADDALVCIDMAAFGDDARMLHMFIKLIETSSDKVAFVLAELLIVQRSTYASLF